MISSAVLSCARCQSLPPKGTGLIEGTVFDQQNHALAGVTVTLEYADKCVSLSANSDAQGKYRFTSLRKGPYALHAKLPGWQEANLGPTDLGEDQVLSIDIHLEPLPKPDAKKEAAQSIEYSNEPTFTVAGVSDPSNLGGHGSDVAVRTKESLARETASLGGRNIEEEMQRAAILREGPDSAELHALLGDIAESEGRPLEAVREYQRAAEMAPTETNLFLWGAELLRHRAWEPASEVFTRGHALFPRSARTLIGLGVSSYAKGLTTESAQQLAEACDIDPTDPMPYTFLGKMQNAEKLEPAGWTERLQRFASLHAENAMAQYYYAVALMKDLRDESQNELASSYLKKAVTLDPKLSEAYLQLGILDIARKDYPQGISNYQKAIELSPTSAEAHFRLAEAYRLTGDRAKAHEQIEIYNQLSKEQSEKSEHDRHEIQQFVYTLRSPAP